MHIGEALNILGINDCQKLREPDLNKIHRSWIREVHPDWVCWSGWSQQQETEMSKRLFDAVEEMRRQLILPPGQNQFNPLNFDGGNNEEVNWLNKCKLAYEFLL